MNVHIRTAFILIVSFLLIGCTESLPKIVQISSSVVFDFKDYESAPEMRLSVYASSENEVQRIQEIRCTHVATGLEWTCRDVRFIAGKKYNWAGYSNIVPPQGDRVPLGKYELFFEDYAGNEVQGLFHVNYPEDYPDSKAKDFPDIVKMPMSVFVALYDENENEVFLGESLCNPVRNIISGKQEEEDLIPIQGLNTRIRKYRFVYQINGGTNIVLMPLEDFPEMPWYGSIEDTDDINEDSITDGALH